MFPSNNVNKKQQQLFVRESLHDFNERFNKGLARKSDPQTSHDSAKSLTKKGLSKIESLIVDALKDTPGGLISEALVQRAGVEWQSLTPRSSKMEERGLIKRNGTRMSSKGRRQGVWQLNSQ